MSLSLKRATGRDSSGRVQYSGYEKVGFKKRESGGGYERSTQGNVSTEKGSLNKERTKEETQTYTIQKQEGVDTSANNPNAVASTMDSSGRPAVIVQNSPFAPRTISGRAAAIPSLVASSRRGSNEFIQDDGQRVNLVSSQKTPDGWGAGVRTQNAPTQTTYAVNNDYRGIRGVSRQASEGYGSVAAFGTQLKAKDAANSEAAKKAGRYGIAQAQAERFGLGSMLTGIGNLGEAYFGQKAEQKSDTRAALSYGFDVGSFAVGRAAGKAVTPLVNKGASFAIDRFGTPAVYRASNYAAGGLAVFGGYGAAEVGKASQTKQGSRAVTSTTAVPIAGFTGGLAEGVFGSNTFGLKRTGSTKGASTVTDQFGGTVGFGRNGVPEGGAQAFNTQQGTINYEFFGRKISKPYTATKSFQLAKVQDGVSTGKSYIGFDTVNPITGKASSSTQTLFAASRGRNLVEISPSGLSGSETVLTSNRKLASNPFGEVVRQTKGKTRTFDVTRTGKVTYGDSVQRTAVAKEISFTQGGGLRESYASRQTLGGTSGVLDPDFMILRQYDYYKGKSVVKGEGVATARASRVRADYRGVDLGRELGLLREQPRARPRLSTSRRGSILESPVLERPITRSRGSSRSVSSPARFADIGGIPDLAGIKLGSVSGAGSFAGLGFSNARSSGVSSSRIRSSSTQSIITGFRSSQSIVPTQRQGQNNIFSVRQTPQYRVPTTQDTVTRVPDNPYVFSFPGEPSKRAPFSGGGIAGLVGGGMSGGGGRRSGSKGRKKDVYASSLTAGALRIRAKKGSKRSGGFGGFELRGL